MTNVSLEWFGYSTCITISCVMIHCRDCFGFAEILWEVAGQWCLWCHCSWFNGALRLALYNNKCFLSRQRTFHCHRIKDLQLFPLFFKVLSNIFTLFLVSLPLLSLSHNILLVGLTAWDKKIPNLTLNSQGIISLWSIWPSWHSYVPACFAEARGISNEISWDILPSYLYPGQTKHLVSPDTHKHARTLTAS